MLMSMSSYKTLNSFEFRRKEAERVLTKYPDRIPIICERTKANRPMLPNIDKNKYLVPNTLTVGQFMYVIRKRIKLEAERALFLFIGSAQVIPATSSLISSLYEQHKDRDGFLYIVYTDENTFGTGTASPHHLFNNSTL